MIIKRNNIEKARVSLSVLGAVLVTGLCFNMLVGTAYGRYSTTVSEELEYDVQAKFTPTVTFPDTHLVSGEGVWLNKEGTQTLELTVSNSDGDEVPTEDISFRIRLFLPNSEDDTADPISDKELTLNIGDTKIYKAIHSELNEETALYGKYGAGWIYTFESGNDELIHILRGNEASEFEVIMTVDSETDLSGYVLMIESIRTAKSEANGNGGAG